MRSDRAWLLDVVDAIDRIERYLPASRASFDDDERTQVWMVHQLQIIGEACGRLSDAFRSRHANVPWRAITGMRHHLVHGYFDVDPDIVWAAVTERIPELKDQLLAALASDPAVKDERQEREYDNGSRPPRDSPLAKRTPLWKCTSAVLSANYDRESAGAGG